MEVEKQEPKSVVPNERRGTMIEAFVWMAFDILISLSESGVVPIGPETDA